MRTLKISLLVFIFSISISAQDFWQHSSFPIILDIDAKNNIILASSGQNGLALSTDYGENWFSTSPTVSFQPYFSLAVHNSGNLFAVGADGYLYRSTDTGITWLQCAGIHWLYNGPNIKCGNNENIYVGSHWGVHRSTDSGETWTLQNNGLQIGGSTPYVRINISNTGILVAATPSGIFKSTNNANSWDTISSIGATNIAINSLGYIYADKYRADPYLKLDTLYRTINNGVSWEALKPWSELLIFISPTDDAIVLAAANYSEGYFLSNDFGLTWTSIITGNSPLCMSYNGNGSYFMGTYGVGILKSNSLTGSWQPSNIGFPGSVTKVSSIISNSGKLFAATRSFGLFASTDNGNSFTKISPGLNEINKLSATSNGYMFAMYGTIFRSTDLGITWSYYPPPHVLYDLQPYSLCTSGSIILTGGKRYAIADAELDQSTDNGESWEEVLSITGTPDQDEFKVIALKMNFDSTALGCVEKRHNINPPWPTWQYTYAIIRSTDYGLSWTSSDYIYDQIHDFAWNYSNEVFAITSQGLIKSTDAGLSWNYTTGTLPTLDLRSLVISYDNIIYIGTGNSGIIYSDDNGNSWNTLNQGMTDTVINSIYISPLGFLFAGTENDGVFRSIDPITSVENPTGILVQIYKLYQNYPNPFNPVTKIKYTIPSVETRHASSLQIVTLKIYDILGREIASLVNKEIRQGRTAGEYEVEFNGSNLPSGIYFYQLKAGQYSETKKMILLK